MNHLALMPSLLQGSTSIDTLSFDFLEVRHELIIRECYR